jgi:hypothetical protein
LILYNLLDTDDVLTKAILGISGTLNTLTAISSALGVTAIRKVLK